MNKSELKQLIKEVIQEADNMGELDELFRVASSLKRLSNSFFKSGYRNAANSTQDAYKKVHKAASELKKAQRM